MKNLLAFIAYLSFSSLLLGQTNLKITNTTVEEILRGQYDPNLYSGGQVWDEPATMAQALEADISADSLKSYILQLNTFGNRNTGSDTVSTTWGFGAARRWVYSKFDAWANESGNRMLPSYFQFDQASCGMGQHRNILAVLPGTDVQRYGIVLIEGHMDSRCASLCDINCPADGIEDNATGTALTMEMARVFSKYQFKNTLVFMVTTGEEQGLLGADAFALYAQQNGLPIRAVQNNDVIGGIHCGETSSSPSCPGIGAIDSTGVRLFSASGNHRQLSRYVKLEYLENLLPSAEVPMDVRIMAVEDRSGRGGDHIPFRQRGFSAMRFTAANEHGNANVTNANYHDRQHTSDDILGVDTDGDNVVDSFFVDFNYLARNTTINANSAAMAAKNVAQPSLEYAIRQDGFAHVKIIDDANLGLYRVMVRSTSNDWDSIFTTTNLLDAFPCAPSGPLYVSVSGVDAAGVESLFSPETFIIVSKEETPVNPNAPSVRLLPNKPNPFDESTWIGFYVENGENLGEAQIRVTDMQGRLVKNFEIKNIKNGLNEVLFEHDYHQTGTFVYSLFLDGKLVESRQMVFAN